MEHGFAYGLQQLLNTAQLAAFLAPLALAFAIIQAITRRVFLSFGELAMFASFAAIYVCFDAMLHGLSDTSALVLSLSAAVLSGAVLGYVVSRVMLDRNMRRNPLAFMIASVGLAIFIQELMRLQSASSTIWVPPLLQGFPAPWALAWPVSGRGDHGDGIGVPVSGAEPLWTGVARLYAGTAPGCTLRH
jgi:branched-chain amino acid transport system permease protein